MNKEYKICPDCKGKIYRKYNSTLWDECSCKKSARSKKRIEKSKALLAQSYTNEKKTTKKGLKSKNSKKIDNQLDAAWSKLVKLIAGSKCEHCRSAKALNSHHIYSRSKKSVRWKTINGICLCVGCHIGVGFSAHKTPIEFIDWLNSYKGHEYMSELRMAANLTAKYTIFEKELILKELLSEINKYETT